MTYFALVQARPKLPKLAVASIVRLEHPARTAGTDKATVGDGGLTGEVILIVVFGVYADRHSAVLHCAFTLLARRVSLLRFPPELTTMFTNVVVDK